MTNFRVGIDFNSGFGGVIEGMRVGGDNTLERGVLAGGLAIVRHNIVLMTFPLIAGAPGPDPISGLVSGNLVSSGSLQVTCPGLVTGK